MKSGFSGFITQISLRFIRAMLVWYFPIRHAIAPQTTPTVTQITASHAHLPCKCLTKRLQHKRVLWQGVVKLPATLRPVTGHVRVCRTDGQAACFNLHIKHRRWLGQ